MTPEQSELKALGFEIPDSITPAVAYRSWRFIDGKMCSHNGTPWIPGKAVRAKCLYNDVRSIHKQLIDRHSGKQLPSDCPLENCTCGIYSSKREMADHIVPRGTLYVHGEVYIWGKIFEGPYGFRSEYAYPKQFFATNEHQKRQLEQMGFGVPVVLVEGVVPNRFPFPAGRAEITKSRLYRQVDRFYAAPILPGLPALAVGIWDSLTQDLSQAYMQVLVAILYLFGLAAAVLSMYNHHLRRKLRRMTR